MASLLVVSYLAGIAALVDTYRRPYSAWEHADRDRGYWVTIGGFMTLLGIGLVYGLSYLTLVVPRFGSHSETHGDFKRETPAR